MIPIKVENVDGGLNPNPKNLKAAYTALDDRERSYYETSYGGVGRGLFIPDEWAHDRRRAAYPRARLYGIALCFPVIARVSDRCLCVECFRLSESPSVS